MRKFADPGFAAGRPAWRGACARQLARGGGPVGRSTRIRSERLQKQTSRKRKIAKAPKLISDLGNPSLSKRFCKNLGMVSAS